MFAVYKPTKHKHLTYNSAQTFDSIISLLMVFLISASRTPMADHVTSQQVNKDV